ncbi:hypothetical protein B0T24DRAFT_610173 [Lasiosphaeria ovina]|uniref:Secreted protein n=1 Tax=Lasiosphaeria ovina TaxID=92902 RepID=A0AAE0KMB5_9PEZI|nr:hypothetical protein B0T24DRAFT_610173 [Lasiosphaeria ovina]
MNMFNAMRPRFVLRLALLISYGDRDSAYPATLQIVFQFVRIGRTSSVFQCRCCVILCCIRPQSLLPGCQPSDVVK